MRDDRSCITASLTRYRDKDATAKEYPKSLNFGHSFLTASPPVYGGEDAKMLDVNIWNQVLK